MAGICNILCLTVIAAVFTSAIAATDYCNLKSCRQSGRIHTMCLYSSPHPSLVCNNYKNRELTLDEKKRIVWKHNQMRLKVASGKETRGINGPQPPAANMLAVTWDNELEMIAQRWADQCHFGHDGCRNVERYWVGQNAAITMNSAENNSPVEDMIQMWYDEVDLFDRNQVPKLTNINGVGHYTQLVWANTSKIGCGRMKWTESKSGWNNNMLICNYGPSGNYIGEPLYEIRE